MHRARSSEMRERLTETGRSTPVQHPRDPMHDLFVTIGRGSRFAANSLLPNGIRWVRTCSLPKKKIGGEGFVVVD